MSVSLAPWCLGIMSWVDVLVLGWGLGGLGHQGGWGEGEGWDVLRGRSFWGFFC